MFDKTIGFIGGGRICKIFLKGWKNAGIIPKNIVVSDINQNQLTLIKNNFPSVDVTKSNDIALKQDIVFLAVHPPVLKNFKGNNNRDSIIISLVPKVTIEKISQLFNGSDNVMRIIPNAASIVNKGYNPFCTSKNISNQIKTDIKKLIEPLGLLVEVNEDKLEAYAIITAMGPTYLWPQLFKLIELSESFGMDKEEAKKAVVMMGYGALKVIESSGFSFKEIEDLIPLKPLKDLEESILNGYITILTDLWNKLKS